MLTKRVLIVAALAAGSVVAPLAALRPEARAQAAPKAPGETDPQTVRLLAQMAASYKALTTYSGTETAEGSPGLGMPYTMRLAYRRPGHIAADIVHDAFGPGHVVHDTELVVGTARFQTSSRTPGRYQHQAMPESSIQPLAVRPDVSRGHQVPDRHGASGRRRPASERDRQDPHTTITLGTPDVMDGVRVDTIVAQSHTGPESGSTILQIGHDDHLLRRCIQSSQSPHENPSGSRRRSRTSTATSPCPRHLRLHAPAERRRRGRTSGRRGRRSGGRRADDEMYAACRALKSFSCTMDFTLTAADAGSGRVNTIPVEHATYAIEKPGRIAAMRTGSEGTTRAVSDGATLYVTTDEPKHSGPLHALPGRYLKLPLQADNINIPYILSNFGGLGTYGSTRRSCHRPFSAGTPCPPTVTTGRWASPAWSTASRWTRSCWAKATRDADYSVKTLAISRRDHLLRQITEEYRPGRPSAERQVNTFTDIKVNPALPSSLFVFTPPPGSRPVPLASDLVASR